MPTVHPFLKTATELRRGINRLMVFRQQSPLDDYVVSGDVDGTIKRLKEAYINIPDDYRKQDADGVLESV